MKCKKCGYCDRSVTPYICIKDNAEIDMRSYERGATMNCSETDRENKEFMEDYVPWKISRGWNR